MRLTHQQYQEIYKKLPEDIQEVAVSSGVNEKIRTICLKHKLHIDEAGIVYDIVMDVVMGIVAAKNMEKEIARELKLAPLDASAISRDIDDQVLASIKDTMIRVYKHSNPFMPQTLQHTDEHIDDVDHGLDKDTLLHEIENPQKVESKKSFASEIIPSIPVPAAPEVQKAPIEASKPVEAVPSPLQKAKERMLSVIGEEKLSSITTMRTVVEAQAIAGTTLAPVVPTPKADTIRQETATLVSKIEEVKKAETPTEITKPNVVPSTPVVTPVAPTIPTAPVAPKVEAPIVPKNHIDPYREPIE